MGKGYVRLHRDLDDCEVFQKREKYCHKMAWVDMIMLASYKDSYFFIRGVRVDLKRGQLGWSEVSLAKRWVWSREKVRRFLAELTSAGMIEKLSSLVCFSDESSDEFQTRQQTIQQKKFVTSIISILNYDKYQRGDTADETANKTADETYTIKDKRKIKERNTMDWPQRIASMKNSVSEIWNANQKNYRAKYPNIDHDLQFQMMLSWVEENPTKANKKKDWNLFIQGWLSRVKPSFSLLKGNGRCPHCNNTGKVERHIWDKEKNAGTVVVEKCTCGR